MGRGFNLFIECCLPTVQRFAYNALQWTSWMMIHNTHNNWFQKQCFILLCNAHKMAFQQNSKPPSPTEVHWLSDFHKRRKLLEFLIIWRLYKEKTPLSRAWWDGGHPLSKGRHRWLGNRRSHIWKKQLRNMRFSLECYVLNSLNMLPPIDAAKKARALTYIHWPYMASVIFISPQSERSEQGGFLFIPRCSKWLLWCMRERFLWLVGVSDKSFFSITIIFR